jgi:hypothetical protein
MANDSPGSTSDCEFDSAPVGQCTESSCGEAEAEALDTLYTYPGAIKGELPSTDKGADALAESESRGIFIPFSKQDCKALNCKDKEVNN